VDNKSEKKDQADALALQELKSSTVDILRKAFNLLDTDHSGFIELAELETLLETRQNLDHESVAEIMKKLDTDGDESTLSFTEFVAIMVVTGAVDEEHGETFSAEEVVSSFSGFAGKTVNKAGGVDFMRPLWEYDDGNTLSCRHRWAKTIDSEKAQYFIMSLVILDIIAVLLKVLVEFTQQQCPGNGKKACCNCAYEARCDKNITKLYIPSVSPTNHRFLGAATTTTAPFKTCDKQPWHGCCHDSDFTDSRAAHYIEEGLHWGSVTILSIFLLQLITLLCLYGKLFCRNLFYIADLAIIVVSLVLEITISEVKKNTAGISKVEAVSNTAGSISNAETVSKVFTALISIVLGWRVVRIIHGLYGHKEKRADMQQEWMLQVLKRFHNRIHNTMMLLTAARLGATSFKDNPMIANRGLSDADATTIKAVRAGNPPGVEELEAVLSRRQEFRHKYEEFLSEMSESLKNVYSQMCAHEKIIQEEIHNAEHHNHATSFGHGHGHGHGDHGDTKKVHPIGDSTH